MSENTTSNILLGVFILCLICYLCSCCYVSCIMGTFFTGVSKLVSFVNSNSKKTDVVTAGPVEENKPGVNKFNLTSDFGNNYMNPGDYMLSPNNYYKLTFQTDGNLVLYDLTSLSGSPVSVWSSKTNGTQAKNLVLTDTGVLELSYGTNVYWSSTNNNKNINTPYTLVLLNNRNLVIYDSRNNIVWQTNTGLPGS